MTRGSFPHSRAEIAALVARSQADDAPMPPCVTAIVDEHGYAMMPIAELEPVSTLAYIHAGINVSWSPMREQGGLLLTQWGGQWSAEGGPIAGITAFMTRDGLRRYIAGLQAIDAAMGER